METLDDMDRGRSGRGGIRGTEAATDASGVLEGSIHVEDGLAEWHLVQQVPDVVLDLPLVVGELQPDVSEPAARRPRKLVAVVVIVVRPFRDAGLLADLAER